MKGTANRARMLAPRLAERRRSEPRSEDRSREANSLLLATFAVSLLATVGSAIVRLLADKAEAA